MTPGGGRGEAREFSDAAQGTHGVVCELTV